MKIYFLLLFAILLNLSCNKKDNIYKEDAKDNNYIVYYFHPTARCESCINLENYIKEVIDTKFANKNFVFKPVNIEEKENEHFRKDYDLKFSSIIIANPVKNKWKNLDSIWSYTEDKNKFFNYAENQINNFINTDK